MVNSIYHWTRRGVIASAAATAGVLALPARSVARASMAPRRSDVCFSTRGPRPDALTAALAFHATRIDWCYVTQPGFVGQARAAGLRVVGGAININPSDGAGAKTYQVGRLKDAAGNPVAAPWMKAAKTYWGCVNNPDFRKVWLDYARRALLAGVDHLQFDDSRANGAAVDWGACWCGYCRSKAAREGVDLRRQMKPFQERSTREFITDMRASIDRIAGRHIAMSCNNFRGGTGTPYDMFDFRIGEIDGPSCAPGAVARMLRESEAAGHPQTFTLRDSSVALNRAMIGWCYANGGQLIVPWDVNVADGAARYYGKPQDFADLYGFVRRLGPVLDEAEQAPIAPGAASVDDPHTQVSLRRAAGFVVLHLVAWAGNAKPGVSIDPLALLPGATRWQVLTPSGAGPVQAVAGKIATSVELSPWAVLKIDRG